MRVQDEGAGPGRGEVSSGTNKAGPLQSRVRNWMRRCRGERRRARDPAAAAWSEHSGPPLTTKRRLVSRVWPRKYESFQTHVSEGPGLHRAGSAWVWESQLLQAGSSHQPAWVPSAALLSGSLGERAMLLARANKTPSTNWDPSAMRGDLSLLSQR